MTRRLRVVGPPRPAFLREAGRMATRAARFEHVSADDCPMAAVYIGGQVVTVRIEDGALQVDVGVGDDESDGGLLTGTDGTIPINFEVEGSAVLTLDQHGVVTAHGWVREQLDV